MLHVEADKIGCGLLQTISKGGMYIAVYTFVHACLPPTCCRYFRYSLICEPFMPSATGMLSRLMRHGCHLPDACQMSFKDPKLLAWLHEPQLMQRDEKEIEGYTLKAILHKYLRSVCIPHLAWQACCQSLSPTSWGTGFLQRLCNDADVGQKCHVVNSMCKHMSGPAGGHVLSPGCMLAPFRNKVFSPMALLLMSSCTMKTIPCVILVS